MNDSLARHAHTKCFLTELLILPRPPRFFLPHTQDIDVWEFHEAFAAQVLSCMAALDSDYFCKNYMGLSGKFGMQA